MPNYPSNLTLLPYEFALSNRVLVCPGQGELLHTSTIENWVINEISRCNNGDLSLVKVNLGLG